MARVPYDKGWLSFGDMLGRLVDRGLVVTHPADAIAFLSHVNYYRFSGYFLAFEIQRNEFYAGTTFEDVRTAYDFDFCVRDLLSEALEVIEIDVRSVISHRFTQHKGAFAHTDSANFFIPPATSRSNSPGLPPKQNPNQHHEWIERLRSDAKESREQFVEHFRRYYAEFPDLPLWMATEVMSFGALTRMLKMMKKSDQAEISDSYGLSVSTLPGLIHHFSYVRNLCAHHSRVWDRTWAVKPSLPFGESWKPPLLLGNDSLFATLLLLSQMLAHCPGAKPFAAAWRQRVEESLKCLPPAPHARERMGLSPDWSHHPEWTRA